MKVLRILWSTCGSCMKAYVFVKQICTLLICNRIYSICFALCTIRRSQYYKIVLWLNFNELPKTKVLLLQALYYDLQPWSTSIVILTVVDLYWPLTLFHKIFTYCYYKQIFDLAEKNSLTLFLCEKIGLLPWPRS